MTDRKYRGIDAKVNSCMWVLMEYAARVKPQVIVMESVRQAYTGGRAMMTALRDDLEAKSGLKYDLYHVMQDAIELGGPAVRKRYFWVASQIPFGVEFPVITRTPTLHDVIGDIEPLAETWQLQPYRRPPSWWASAPRSTSGAVDGHMTRTGIAHRRTLDLLTLGEQLGEPWPQGWHVGKFAQHIYDRHGCLPDSWLHLKSKLLGNDFHMGYISVTRWDDNRSARVITGGALDLVLHPTQPRFISHREVARVMGFPDDWRILPLRDQSSLKATWGKGITTHCGRWIGEQARAALDGAPNSFVGTPVGDREWLIKRK
jgi:site-specific DNA-cytosine methylase